MPELRTANPTPVTDATYQQEVVQSDRPVLLVFWREGCGPCRATMPGVRVVTAEFDDRLKVAAHEVTEITRTVRRHRVQGTPTLILLDHGREVWRHQGLLQLPPMRAKLSELLDQLETGARTVE